MNILPCLILCVAFASCVSNESAGTTVDANLGVLYNRTLKEYLLQHEKHEDFVEALCCTYRALKNLLTKQILLNLTALTISTATKTNTGGTLGKVNGFLRLTAYEYRCYYDFYFQKIEWIRGALQQKSHSTEDIMVNIALLIKCIHSLTVVGSGTHRGVKKTLEDGVKIPSELNLLATILGYFIKLEQAHWAVLDACMLKYEEDAKSVNRRIIGKLPDYVANFRGFIALYEKRKADLIENGGVHFESVLRKEFLDEFTRCVVKPDEEFQENLVKISSSTLLEPPKDTTPKDTSKEEQEILKMILKGILKRFESPAAKTDPEESASEEVGAKIDVEDLLIESVMGQLSKKQMRKDAKKVKKEMVEYTGGIRDNREKKMKRFMELHDKLDKLYDKLDKNSVLITYGELRELFSSEVWSWYGINTEKIMKIMKIDSPHGGFGWDDWILGGTRSLCNKKWKSIKSHDNYLNLLEDMKEYR